MLRAVKDNNAPLIQAMLDAGKDITQYQGGNGESILDVAANKSYAVMKLLFENGVYEPNAAVQSKMSAKGQAVNVPIPTKENPWQGAQ